MIIIIMADKWLKIFVGLPNIIVLVTCTHTWVKKTELDLHAIDKKIFQNNTQVIGNNKTD
jgi:hypothetical protein